MIEKIIRTPAQIPGATLECLLLSYSALTGRPITHFKDRATAERRLEMAMLSAKDATAHAGVPKGTTVITPKTAEELGQPLWGEGAAEEQDSAHPCHCQADWQGMVEKLCKDDCSQDLAPAQPKPTKVRGRFERVRAAGHGTSRLQPSSVRNAVMQAILSTGTAGTTLVALDEKFPPTARGHVQKLLASGHAECFNA